MTITVPTSQPQVAIRVPAHRFNQGGRTAYSFALSLAELDGLLPQRVDEEVIREANRRMTPTHARAIQDYLENREDWVLGAVLLGISPEATKFEPYMEEGGRPSKRFGELQLLASRINSLRLLDGQHRRRAIQDALAHLHDERQRLRRTSQDAEQGGQIPEVLANLQREQDRLGRKIRDLEAASVPVVIYEEADIQALRRMFADAAKTKPIDAVTKARFDDRNAFNLAAQEVADVSKLLAGRVEMDRSTVSRTSTSLLAFNQLSEILRTLMYGYYGRVSRVRNDELLANREPIVDIGLEWADDFLPAARSEYEQFLSDEAEDELAVKLRPTSFALNASVLRVLAGCFHDWKEEVGDDTRHLAAFLRQQSFKPGAQGGILVKAGLVPPGGSTPVARRQEVQQAIRYIVSAAKESIP